MTPEQRLDRTERILRLMIRSGRRSRSEWRERVNILISMHERHAEESRVESRDIKENINILIQSQIETGDVVRKTSEQLRQTDEQLRNLGTRHDQEMAELRNSQKLTDQALRAFIDSLRKGRNGARSD